MSAASPRLPADWSEPSLWNRVERVSVLDADPELFAGVGAAQRAVAARASLARSLRIPPGEWTPDPRPSGYGLLVLEGRLLRRTAWRDRAAAELLSGGDLVQTWTPAAAEAVTVTLVCGYRAVGDVRVAVLDTEWLERVARWPSVSAALMARAVARSRRTAALMAIMQVRRLDTRLWLLLWLLAERFGHVHVDGVRVDLPLTHRELAELAGARRPSLSAALARLAREGRVCREGTTWRLTGPTPG